MAVTAENIFSSEKIFTSSDTIDTEYDVFNGGVNQGKVAENVVLTNNSTSNINVTIYLKKYNGSYSTVFEQTYTILAGESDFAAEFFTAYNADATNPDKLTASIDVLPGASESLTVFVAGVSFL